MRTEEADFLDNHPIANHVLNVIARRARRTPCKLNKLEIGECFIGHKGLGITERQYRTAKKQLSEWTLVEFKRGRKATDKGTVAKLLDSRVYDINATESDGRKTEERRKGDGKETTNKECNKVKNEETIPLTKIKEIPEGLNHEAWGEWLSYKKEIKSQYKTERGEKAKANELIKLGAGIEVNQLLIVRQSIDNEWKGFFQLKNKPAPQQQPQQQHYDHEAARQREIEEIRKGLM